MEVTILSRILSSSFFTKSCYELINNQCQNITKGNLGHQLSKILLKLEQTSSYIGSRLQVHLSQPPVFNSSCSRCLQKERKKQFKEKITLFLIMSKGQLKHFLSLKFLPDHCICQSLIQLFMNSKTFFQLLLYKIL